MNKIICTFVTASVLVSGAAYGQSKPKTNHDKQPLRDSQMDKVTAAGEDAGGRSQRTTRQSREQRQQP